MYLNNKTHIVLSKSCGLTFTYNVFKSHKLLKQFIFILCLTFTYNVFKQQPFTAEQLQVAGLTFTYNVFKYVMDLEMFERLAV